MVDRVSHGLVVSTLFLSVVFLDHGGGNGRVDVMETIL